MSEQPETHDDRCEMYSEGCGCESREKLKAERDALRALLLRIRAWDMMDAATDGAFWRREIDAAIDAAREAGK